MSKTALTLSVIILSLLVIPSVIPSNVNAQAESETWTFMIYMGGDGRPDDISEQVDEDMNELLSVDTVGKIEIIVLKDQKEEGDSELFRLSREKEEISLTQINTSWTDELDMNDPRTLRDFADWGVNTYQSDNYFLDIWGHGGSWRGLALEDSGYLTFDQVDWALEGLHFDVMGFDACTMGMIENYYQFKEHASVVIASEKEETLAGWPYNRIMEKAMEHPNLDPVNISKIVVDEFVRWSANYSSVSSSLTAVDTSLLPVSEMQNLTQVLESFTPYFYEQIEDAWCATERYDPYPYPRDLYHFTENLDQEIDSVRLKRTTEELRQGLKRAIIAHKVDNTGSEDPIYHSNGYGIYFPTGSPSSRYSDLDFSELSWDEWLETFYDPGEIGVSYPLFLNISNNDECTEVTLYTNKTGSVIQMYVYSENKTVKRFEIEKNQIRLNVSLDYGEYRFEAFLSDGGKVLNYTFEDIVLSNSIKIFGTVDSESSVDFSIYNKNNKKWKNVTLQPGAYAVNLAQPDFCKPGDTLILRYETENELREKSMPVGEQDIEHDIYTGSWFSKLTWLLIVNIVCITLGSIVFTESWLRNRQYLK